MSKIFTKRARFEIVYDVLSTCLKPSRKTSILFKCNMSFDQLQKYLQFLASRGMIEHINNGGKNLYQVTEHGRKFLEEYVRLEEMVSPKDGRNRRRINNFTAT